MKRKKYFTLAGILASVSRTLIAKNTASLLDAVKSAPNDCKSGIDPPNSL